MKKRVHSKKIGRHILLGPIGRGGMSIVYRALEPDEEKIVALKLLFPLQPMTDLLGIEKLRNIFTAEAEKMADLNHPHIVKVLDLELDSRTPYFTMEYHCSNIGTMINENFILEESTRTITPEKVLDYGTQVLDGLQFIHEAGIIHRDIKPHNILVTDTDSAKICDFGTALQENEETFDSTALKVGSPYYTAPEQEKDPEYADQRSDLYSVAVMLYRMLTGLLPGVKKISLSRINSPGRKNWNLFFRKGLEQNPARRFQNTREMTTALKELGLLLENRLDSACRVVRPEKSDPGQTIKKIRNAPIRAAGINAMEAFQVNELWQPKQYLENIFTGQTKNTVTDRSTGLIWQRKGSGKPLDHGEADSFIELLNETQKFGISTWRLPTVNELLTLANNPQLPESRCSTRVWPKMRQWYWSCDLRSKNTSWYVNTALGYAGWQDNSCRNYVRAVTSLPDE